MKTKNNLFHKIVMTFSAIMSTVSAFALSTAGAVTTGAAATVGAVVVGKKIHEHRKKTRYGRKKEQNKEFNKQEQKKETKQALKKRLLQKQVALKHHRTQLKKLERLNKKIKEKGNTEQANKHRSIIVRLERLIDEIKADLERLV